MKTITKPVIRPRHNPELDKWDGIDLFPEKTAKAKEFLAKHPFPEHLLKRKKQ